MNTIFRGILMIVAGWLYFNYVFKGTSTLSSITLIIVCALLLMGMESIKRKKDKMFKLQSDTKAIEEMKREEFIAYVAELFKRLDYFIEPNKTEKKIQGTDLVVRKGTRVMCMRCEVGEVKDLSALQTFYGSIKQYPSKKSLVICNDYFSEEAKQFAKLNHIQLMDKRQLIKIIDQVVAEKKTKDILEAQEV